MSHTYTVGERVYVVVAYGGEFGRFDTVAKVTAATVTTARGHAFRHRGQVVVGDDRGQMSRYNADRSRTTMYPAEHPRFQRAAARAAATEGQQ